MPEPQYDAVLVLSFGGPEKPEDVIPFLENVLRGRNVPRERMLEVAEHYHHFGGKSPINEQNRALIAALEGELHSNGPQLPVYWGNRNWHPLLADTLREMQADGVKRAIAYATSAFSSYSGCRQYLEDIDRARAEVGPGAPQIDKLRLFYNHPWFIEAAADRVQEALYQLDAGQRPQAQN
jgi:ferrochelatase